MLSRRQFLFSMSGGLALTYGLGSAEGIYGGLHHLTSHAGGLPHPDPREGVTGERVLPESEIGTRRRTVEAYDAARTYPEIFDGVYCACRCDKTMNHRSLLSCFESRQAIGCRACREQAELVTRLAREGKTLAEIRVAVDREFAS